MLNIAYISDTQLVEISYPTGGNPWLDIKRLCEDSSSEISIISSTSIRIPWWVFLTITDRIGYIIGKYGLNINLDDQAKKLLIKSKETKKLYNELVENTDNVPIEKVKKELKQKGFERELTKNQLENVSKMLSYPAAATFSVPGAGKTTEALAYYYLKRKEDSKLLVVAPKNAFASWEEQLEECIKRTSLRPKIVRLRGSNTIPELIKKEPEISLITYSQLLYVVDTIARFLSSHNFFMFLDESHRIKKGDSGSIGSSILKLSHIPDHKLIMSGTPMPNSIDDLVPQFSFLYPGEYVDETNVEEKISPIYVRTTKDELGLKQQKFNVTEVEMSANQRRLYELLRSEQARRVASLKSRDRNTLRSLGKSVLRLIQLTSNPSLLSNSDFSHHKILRDVLLEGDSTKIKYVCNRVRELASKGQKVIVWSSFVQNVELIASRLLDLGADYIHGGVDSGGEDDLDTREAKIKRFHEDPNAFVLVANPAAASEGISLHTVCHYAIYLDRNYNAAQYLQSLDRIHRLGLPEHIDTNIEIVSCPDTIDESVHRRLMFKINRMSEVLNDRSLQQEYEYYDEEDVDIDTNIKMGDIEDYIRHLNREECEDD